MKTRQINDLRFETLQENEIEKQFTTLMIRILHFRNAFAKTKNLNMTTIEIPNLDMPACVCRFSR